MKKIITSAALILTVAGALAQENYTVKTNMKIEGLPPEYAGFGENEIVTYIKGEKFKSEVTGMMGSTVNSFDGKVLTFVTEQMGNKFGYTATKEELEASAKSGKSEKPKIEYTNEKKTIAGYECSKAIITSADKDKKESKVIIWYTDKIKDTAGSAKMAGRRGGGMDLEELKGYPLSIETAENKGGMEMKILISAVEVGTGNIDDSVFKVSTDGYTMMTYKEYQEKMKAMGGSH